jgi:hypothetical protein
LVGIGRDVGEGVDVSVGGSGVGVSVGGTGTGVDVALIGVGLAVAEAVGVEIVAAVAVG